MERDIKLELDNILDMFKLVSKMCNTPNIKINPDANYTDEVMVFEGIEYLAEAVGQRIKPIESLNTARHKAAGFMYKGVTVYSLYDEGEEDDHLRGCKEET